MAYLLCCPQWSSLHGHASLEQSSERPGHLERRGISCPRKRYPRVCGKLEQSFGVGRSPSCRFGEGRGQALTAGRYRGFGYMLIVRASPTLRRLRAVDSSTRDPFPHQGEEGPRERRLVSGVLPPGAKRSRILRRPRNQPFDRLDAHRGISFMQGDKWVPIIISRMRWEAAISENGCQCLWSNYGHEYLPSSIECALASHPPRVFSVRHEPRPFHGGNNCSVSSDRRFVAKSGQTGFFTESLRARSSSSARSSLFPYRGGLTNLGLSH
jgi:hypothetical protein